MATFKDLFNESFYLAQNADVAAAIKSGAFKGSAFDHYNTFGFREGRDPNALFDSSFYLLNNLDVFQAGINPLMHYFDNGGFEGRDPSAFFDSSYYLATNFDVANALVNPLWHFINFGGKEGRDPHTGFDSSKYLADNPDVAAAGVNPLIHYLQFGQKEGRPAFDTQGTPITGSPDIPEEGQLGELFFQAGPDNLNGTAGNDIATANLSVSPEGVIVNTLNSADNANFGLGNDTANVRVSATAAGNSEYEALAFGPRPTLTSLEQLNFEVLNGNLNFDGSGTSGLTGVGFLNQAGNLTINNLLNLLPNGVTLTNGLGGNPTLRFLDTVLSGTSDAITVTLATTNAVLNNFGVVTVNSQTGPNVVETVNLVSTGVAATNTLNNIVGGTAALNINLNAAGLTITNDTTHTTVDVVGSKNFTANGELLGATTITAGTFTGNFTANVDDSLAVNITTGSGNDTVDFSDDAAGYGALGTPNQDTWNAGAGTDRIILRNGDVVGNAALTQSQTNLSGVEEGQIQDNLEGTAVLQHFNSVGINTWFFSGSADNDTNDQINFGSALVTMTLGGDFNDQLTVNHVGVTGSDSLVFNMNGDVGENGVATEHLIFAGWEGITINSTGTTDDSPGGNSIVSHEVLGDLRATTTGAGPTAITLTGSSNFEIRGSSDVAVLNGAAFTGRLIMSNINGTDLAAFAGIGTGASLTGGSGNDVLVGNPTANLIDTIVGGGGNDIILPVVSGGAAGQGDVLTGNAGNDFFVFQGTNFASMLTVSGNTTQVVHITDFVSGSDKIAFVDTAGALGANNGTNTSFVIDATVNIATAANLAALWTALDGALASNAALSAAGGVLNGYVVNVAAGTSAGTYLYVNDDNAAIDPTTDTLINLTGITGTFQASDVTFSYNVA